MTEKIEIVEDLKGLYEMARTDTEPYAPCQVTSLIERISRAEQRVRKLEEIKARLEKELDTGDSWQWIRGKFEAASEKYRWYHPRTDGLAGTRYEVMGWLHCLFSDADPKVFIDIALEHQKRTDEAEAQKRELEQRVKELERNAISVPDGFGTAQEYLQSVVDENNRFMETIYRQVSEKDKFKAENARLKAPVTDIEWYDNCDRDPAGYVLPTNGMIVSNRIIAARAAQKREA